MDSDDSRPGSSASNSSSSSNNSNEASPNSQQRKSRSKTRSKSASSRSSNSSSSRGSRGGDSNGPKSPPPEPGSRSPSRSPTHLELAPDADNKSIRSMSPENDEHPNQNRSVSRNQSISPARKSNSKSSRNSSVSSVSDVENFKADEISDGEMDSDKDDEEDTKEGRRSIEKTNENGKSPKNNAVSEVVPITNHVSEALNMSHEDLSDVSDLESAPSENGQGDNDDKDEPDDDDEDEDRREQNKSSITDLRQKLDERKNQLKSMEKDSVNDVTENGKVRTISLSSSVGIVENSEIVEKKNDEDALDFEAEEGECNDPVAEDTSETKEVEEKKDSDGEVEEGEELEEGEVSDEDEKRPEETEPKPVCRFYTRGQCTWGMSCRFLHPGVTDKGNYTMFDMIRPVPVPHSGPYGAGGGGGGGGAPPGYHDFRNDRPLMHHSLPAHPAFAVPAHARPPIAEPSSESAWERGLRTAKEMMRKAIKRKEQDMDFEDKKMNLSASHDELEKDNYLYIRDRASPDASPQYPPVPKPIHYDTGYSPPPHKYPPGIPGGRGLPGPAFDEDPYGRSARYRELPPHRMPQYEDEVPEKRRVRPTREVIVQRAEPVVRGDEWNDPWMRSKSPGRGGDKRSRRDRRSYSSNSSYSSSSSSRSGSSSNTSRSPSPNTRRRRFNSGQSSHKSPPPPARRHPKRSPSPPPTNKRRHSPKFAPPAEKPNFEASKKDFRNLHTAASASLSSNKRLPPQNIGATARRSPPMLGRKRNVSPTIEKRSSRVSPPLKRKRPSPITARKPVPNAVDKSRKKRRSSSSGSGSSDSSGSESGSSYSSSSSSSSRAGARSTAVTKATAVRGREKIVQERKVVKKVEMSKKRSPIIEAQNNKSATNSAAGNINSSSTSSSASASKKTTRREELLKQLRAVEDAIARKRSKLT